MKKILAIVLLLGASSVYANPYNDNNNLDTDANIMYSDNAYPSMPNQNSYSNQNQNFSNQNPNYSNQNQNFPNQNQNFSNQNSGYSDSSNQDNFRNRTTSTNLANPNTQNNSTKLVDDGTLQKNIKDALSSGWFSKGYEQVRVNVNNGTVTLEGFVNTPDDKMAVEKKVGTIDGVRQLYSLLVIQDRSQATSANSNGSYNSNSSYNNNNSYSNNDSKAAKNLESNQQTYPQDKAATQADQLLNSKIRDKVSNGWFWDSYKDVSLDTNNGVVTLNGTVDSQSDQQKIADKISKIDGVRSVKSNLQYKKSSY